MVLSACLLGGRGWHQALGFPLPKAPTDGPTTTISAHWPASPPPASGRAAEPPQIGADTAAAAESGHSSVQAAIGWDQLDVLPLPLAAVGSVAGYLLGGRRRAAQAQIAGVRDQYHHARADHARVGARYTEARRKLHRILAGEALPHEVLAQDATAFLEAHPAMRDCVLKTELGIEDEVQCTFSFIYQCTIPFSCPSKVLIIQTVLLYMLFVHAYKGGERIR